MIALAEGKPDGVCRVAVVIVDPLPGIRRQRSTAAYVITGGAIVDVEKNTICSTVWNF
jgi:hypothetical protein